MKVRKTFLKYITVGGLTICLVIVLVPFYTIIVSYTHFRAHET